jgi:hypothetical protein
MTPTLYSTKWPLPVPRLEKLGRPKLPPAVEEFQQFGGDTRFLSWVDLLPSRPREQFLAKEHEDQLAGSQKHCRALRKSLDVLSIRGRFPELKLIEPLLLDLDLKMSLTLDENKRRQKNVLNQLRLRSATGGHPIKKYDLYRWLGILVPYTALGHQGRPRWAWIDRWLVYRGIELPNGRSQKYWNDSVSEPWKKKKSIRHDLAALLAREAKQYPLYLSTMSECITPNEKRKATILAQEYRKIVDQILPWTKR